MQDACAQSLPADRVHDIGGLPFVEEVILTACPYCVCEKGSRHLATKITRLFGQLFPTSSVKHRASFENGKKNGVPGQQPLNQPPPTRGVVDMLTRASVSSLLGSLSPSDAEFLLGGSDGGLPWTLNHSPFCVTTPQYWINQPEANAADRAGFFSKDAFSDRSAAPLCHKRRWYDHLQRGAQIRRRAKKSSGQIANTG